jgi:predicted Zn-dependent protease
MFPILDLQAIHRLQDLVEHYGQDARLDCVSRRMVSNVNGQSPTHRWEIVQGVGVRVQDSDGDRHLVQEGDIEWDTLASAMYRSGTASPSGLRKTKQRRADNAEEIEFPDAPTSEEDEILQAVGESVLHQTEADIPARYRIATCDGYRLIVLGDGSLRLKNLGLTTVYVDAVLQTGKGGTVTIPYRVGGRDRKTVLNQARRGIDRWKERLSEMRCAESVGSETGAVVLSPSVAAFLIHEAFGHLCEADRIPSEKRDTFPVGVRVASSIINIRDVPNPRDACGGMAYDDEGTPCEDTPLVIDGRWAGLLHTQETGRAFGVTPTGNARTTSFRFPPISRMRTTILDPGPEDADDLVESIEHGLFLDAPIGGQLRGTTARVYSAYGHRIVNGRKARPIGPTVLSVEPLRVLGRIRGLGADTTLFRWLGNCDRGQQAGLPVSMAAPTLLLDDVHVMSR